MDTRSVISENIKNLRLHAGMTQEDVAEQLSYTVQAVSRWERGKSLPDAEVLARIAALYQVPIEYLFSEEHITVDEEAEKKARKRETVFRLLVVLIVLGFMWAMLTVVLIFAEDNSHLVGLWLDTGVIFTLMVLSYVFRFARAQIFTTSFFVWCAVTTFYFEFHLQIANLKYVFIGAAVLQFLYIFYLLFLKRGPVK